MDSANTQAPVPQSETKDPRWGDIKLVNYAINEDGTPRQWSEADTKYIAYGMEKTNPTVPAVYGENTTFVVLKWHDDQGYIPVGLFFLFPGVEGFCEVGIRLWGIRLPHKLVVSSMKLLFITYQYAIARIYSNNKSIKLLLARSGGRYLSRYKDDDRRTVEVWGWTKEDFLAAVKGVADDAYFPDPERQVN